MFETIISIAEQIFLYLPLIAGAYLSISLMKIPNLSIEAAYVTGAIFAGKAVVFVSHAGGGLLLNLLVAVSASVLGGMLVGLLVGALTLYGKIPHLLASIVAMGVCFGANLYLLGSSNMPLVGVNNPLALLPASMHPEVVMLACVGACVCVLLLLFLRTQLGISLAVYGNNPRFFGHYNISTRYVVLSGLMLSNALAGLSGYLVAQTSGFVDINAGVGVALFCLTALVLGNMMLRAKRVVTMTVPVLGLTAYCLLQQLLLKVGFNLKYFTLVQSIIVLIVLVVRYQKHNQHELHNDHLGV